MIRSSFLIRCAAVATSAVLSGCIVPPATHKLPLERIPPLVTSETTPDGATLFVGPEMKEEFGLAAGEAESVQLRSTLRDGQLSHVVRLSLQVVAASPPVYSTAQIYSMPPVDVRIVQSSSTCNQGHCTHRTVLEIPLTEAEMRLGEDRGLGLRLVTPGGASRHFVPPSYVRGQLIGIERLRT